MRTKSGGRVMARRRGPIARLHEDSTNYVTEQNGGSGSSRSVDQVRAARAGAGFVFEDATTGGSVPREFVPAVEKGLKIQKEDGVLAHFPTVDFKATLHDGSYHDVDSNALTFEIASKACFREGIRKAGPQLLEPVMKVETVSPGDYLGDVIGDMNRRRGTISSRSSAVPTPPWWATMR